MNLQVALSWLLLAGVGSEPIFQTKLAARKRSQPSRQSIKSCLCLKRQETLSPKESNAKALKPPKPADKTSGEVA